ncbi:DNA processing protein DprA [bacterium HR21]|nr:DNA processing protein DprA [bacterium HR21]
MGWQAAEILLLQSVPGLSARTVLQLVQRYPAFEHFQSALAAGALRQLGLFTDSVLDQARSRARDILQRCQQLGIRIVTVADADYPHLLRHIPYPPVVLYVRGQLQSENVPVISIVGTRRCTLYGRLCAERFSEACVRAGAVVCSGLAQGIDTIAHQTALRAHGITYAVVASGLDRIQPVSAARLAEQILEYGGAVLSEYPPGTRALPAYFPQRNRIISGLARAVLVVESGIPGGALLTAHFAFDQGRDVYAIPGNITSEKSAGTNMLIRRQIATPALSPEDFLADLGLTTLAPAAPAPTFHSPAEERLYALLGSEPLHIDVLSDRAGLPVHEALAHLLELEFRGLVRQLPGKYFIRSA